MTTNNHDNVARIAALFDSVGHPIRLRVLIALNDAKRPMSPNELCEQLAPTTLGTTAYHVRILTERKLIKLTGERRVRGAVEHFYRPTATGRKLLKLIPTDEPHSKEAQQ